VKEKGDFPEIPIPREALTLDFSVSQASKEKRKRGCSGRTIRLLLIFFLALGVFSLISFLYSQSVNPEGSQDHLQVCSTRRAEIDHALELFCRRRAGRTDDSWKKLLVDGAFDENSPLARALISDGSLRRVRLCQYSGKYFLEGGAANPHIRCTLHGTDGQPKAKND